MSKSRDKGGSNGTDQFLEKPLPHAISMERSVLGAVELDNGLCDEMQLLLKRDDFFLDSHRRIYDKMITLKAAQQPIDLLTLSEALRASNEFEKTGGLTYLAGLIDGVPRTDTIEPYAKFIKRRSQARKRIDAAYNIISDNFEDPDDPELGSRAEAEMNAIANEDTDKAEVKPLANYANNYIIQVKAARDRGQRITGIPTLYDGLDLRTLGLQRQELMIVAARVSIGKTTWSYNISHNLAKEDYRVLFWSGEMPGERIAEKGFAKEAMIDSFRMRSGEFDDYRIDEAQREFDSWRDRFMICDKPNISAAEFRALCRRQKTRYGLDVAVADYLLLFADPFDAYDRRDAVSKNTLMLKNLARELDIAVILLHQLSRAPEGRSGQDQCPRLSDLAESGDVERHADTVAFLWRDRKPKKGEEDITKVFLAKNRNGPCGHWGMLFIKSQQRFENLADDRLFDSEPIQD